VKPECRVLQCGNTIGILVTSLISYQGLFQALGNLHNHNVIPAEENPEDGTNAVHHLHGAIGASACLSAALLCIKFIAIFFQYHETFL
jgi:hypothetical protein